MARYTGPVCKLCRREGDKLFLKGARCFSPKCAMERRAYPPGQHGRGFGMRRRRRPSDYARQLREKQKARRIYGVLERQFRRYYREAMRRTGMTGENLLVILESRMDNVVYRMGFASSRNQGRQLLRNGHFLVNDKRVDIPSYQVRKDDVVSVKERSLEILPIMIAVDTGDRTVPEWMDVNVEERTITIKDLPSREQIDTQIQEQLVVELYSK